MDIEIKRDILSTKKKNKKSKTKSTWLLWLFLFILIIVSGTVLFFNLKMSGYLDKILPPDNNFYLVYLNLGNNNISYYGQGLEKRGDYLILNNPFYLQPTKDQATGDTILNLRKIEDEFYKPLSEIKILKHSIIFIQQLQSDSPLIQEYNKIK